MPNDFNASADTALAEGTGPVDPLAGLTAYFEAQQAGDDEQDTDQIDNPTDDAAVSNDEAESEPDQSSDSGETDQEAPASTNADQAANDDVDFQAIENPDVEFIDDPKALKAKFPRNSSNELIAEMAEYGKAAKKGAEVIQSLGGEEFIPGVSTIATGLKAGNPRDVFTGIIQTAGAEELVKVMADAVYVGLVQADQMATQPDTAAFGQALTQVVNAALQERFGPQMTTERMGKLALWDQAGWFEKIEQWIADEYVDRDDLTNLIESTNNPDLLKAQQRIKELEAQVGQKEPKDGPTAQRQAEVENTFSKWAAEQIESILTNQVWKNSTLRELPTDSAELKQEKAFLRGQLSQLAVNAFNSSADRQKLLDGYRTGKNSSAVYKTEFVTALNQAILATKEPTATATRLLAKVYGKSRNSQLANNRRLHEVPTGSDQPTDTQDFGDEADRGITRDSIVKSLEQRIAAL